MRFVARLLSALVAVALLAGALLILLELVARAVDANPVVVPYHSWYEQAQTHRWNATGVRGLLLATAGTGLVLAVTGAIRRRDVTLDGYANDTVTLDVRRDALRRALERTVRHVDGVNRRTVRITPPGVRVRVRTNRQTGGDLETTVAEAVQRHLATIGLNQPLEARVNVTTRQRR